MNIGGFIPLSLVDWDGEPCSVVFVTGCQFRCPWCHNKDIVFDKVHMQVVTPKMTTDAVCITGGEPTIQKGLISFCKLLKQSGKKIKLDTNGMKPDILFELLNRELIDYIAMDIKAPLVTKKYSKSTGVQLKEEWLTILLESISLITRAAPSYEFRTTIVPTFHIPKDIEQIAKYAIKGAKKYVIQNFRPCDSLIDHNLASLKPFSQTELEAFAEAAKPFVQRVTFRTL